MPIKEAGQRVKKLLRKYMFTYQQNIEHNHKMKVANTSIKNLAKFVYLGTTLTNQNYIHEEIKTILNFNQFGTF